MSMRVKYFCLHDDEAEAGIVNSKADFLSDPGSNRGLFFGKSKIIAFLAVTIVSVCV